MFILYICSRWSVLWTKCNTVYDHKSFVMWLYFSLQPGFKKRHKHNGVCVANDVCAFLCVLMAVAGQKLWCNPMTPMGVSVCCWPKRIKYPSTHHAMLCGWGLQRAMFCAPGRCKGETPQYGISWPAATLGYSVLVCVKYIFIGGPFFVFKKNNFLFLLKCWMEFE